MTMAERAGALHHATAPETAESQEIADSDVSRLQELVLDVLEDAKAENIVSIDLAGKSLIADRMVVASGRSQRHVGAIADQLQRKLKDAGHGSPRVEGLPHCDWVLIDCDSVVVHIFRPEVREFYNLEKMWSVDRVESQHFS